MSKNLKRFSITKIHGEEAEIEKGCSNDTCEIK
jgi:hypothetical protein